MTPTNQKVVRGLIYCIAMGAVSAMVVMETSEWHVIMGVAYILGALLVFGVDIRSIEAGPVKIEFDDKHQPDLDEWGN